MNNSIQPSNLGLNPSNFPEFRPWQLPAIKEILSFESQIGVLTAGTGVGKTLIAIGSALLASQRVLYLCATKAQAQQVLSDFSSVGAYMLHGHNNFPCYDPLHSCNPQDCSYEDSCKVARDHPIVITNNAHWFALGNSGKRHLLGQFNLIIYDEAHKIHDILCHSNQIELDRYEVQQHFRTEQFPNNLTSITQWVEWG